MIEIDVEKYCQECPDFKPKKFVHELEDVEAGEVITRDTIIFCKHEKKCTKIAKYIEERIRNNEKVCSETRR